ncbi:hypothetical protein M3Y98_00195900 [Aphelenchoides besseyi]|nr:hypothetical protein M3Y98_00195900 [Aphelenchoides besseyi]KAI6200253.1 hypothetical protein M3Y96_00713700 [Aphelenchoides besseyi]
MSWKEIDPLKVWTNSSIVPVKPKPKDPDDELITRERSTVIQAIQEMRGEDQDRYLSTLVQNWPFKWEKRAFEIPGHVAAMTCGSTGLFIGVKITGEAFHPGMNYGFIQTIRQTPKSSLIPPCYISLMTAFALWTVYIKRSIMRDGDVCSSCILYRALTISFGSGVLVPMISAPFLAHGVASFQKATNVQPTNLMERLAMIVEYNKPIVRQIPKMFAIHLAVSAICVYSTLWGWRNIYQTLDVDPDFIREAVEKEPNNTGLMHRIRNKIMNTVDYINSI